MRFFKEGLGLQDGAALGVANNVYVSGRVVWVNSSSDGADDTPDVVGGGSKNKPYATLAAAIADYVYGDIILVGDGHSEVVTGEDGIELPSGITILCEGTSDGVPNNSFKKLLNDDNDSPVFTITGPDIYVSNLRTVSATPTGNFDSEFGEWVSNAPAYSTHGIILDSCHWYLTGRSAVGGFLVGDAFNCITFENCIFKCSASLGGALPVAGLNVESASTRLKLELNGCVFDGGEICYFDGIKNTTWPPGMTVSIDTSLIRGANLNMESTESRSYIVHVATCNGGGQVSSS